MIHAEPLGVDFAESLAAGLRDRLSGRPPEAMARVTVIVNAARMARRLEQILSRGGAAYRPRILMVSDVSPLLPTLSLPPPERPLATRLALTRLVREALEREPSLGPRGAAFELAGSLGELLAEMEEEGVGADALEAIDAGDHAAHWARHLTLLRIAARYEASREGRTPARRQARCLDALEARWRERPTDDMVIVAGSTASRAPTRRLMEIVDRLPHGHVILPGLDRAMPDAAWAGLAGEAEDHPQVRHARLLRHFGLERGAVPRWSDLPVANPARTALVSLALRPPPVTDAWQAEGPAMAPRIPEAMEGVVLCESATPAEEAEVIALRLRGAVEEGTRAALITPDRVLSRAVAAHLDRWGIVPDDSAGLPLDLSPPGRLILQAARMRGARMDAAGLVGLLKHPLAHTAGDRLAHLRAARRLELRALRGRMAFPTGPALRAWFREKAWEDDWAGWVADLVGLVTQDFEGASLAEHVSAHVGLMVALAGGSDEAARAGRPTGALWDGPAGRQARQLMEGLAREAAGADLSLTAAEYARMVADLLRGAEPVRDPVHSHPDVMIWGALEGRVQGAPLTVLGGLVEGVWPSLPGADPWLNREMRRAAGLRSPERTVGLSAHDFQQALGGEEVWLSRARRDAESETVPSRWLNRLLNLLRGLDGGAAALERMERRAEPWRRAARALTAPSAPPARAPRPAPAPPVEARPTELRVTEVETLIRDPYAVYARRVLGLGPLDPLGAEPDPRTRGMVIHAAVEAFAREDPGPLGEDAADRLRGHVAAALSDLAWPSTRVFWEARVERVAEAFLSAEAERRRTHRPVVLEGEATWPLPGTRVTLVGRADRIDLPPEDDGPAAIYDYKTGTLPSGRQMENYSLQLQLEAMMLEAGAFRGVAPRRVEAVAFLGLGTRYEERRLDTPPEVLAAVRAKVARHLAAYEREAKGFAARRANATMAFGSPYDRLSRYGEWTEATEPTTIPVGRKDGP